MARRLRFIPEGGALVEVTCRTIQGRYLLRPSKELRSITLGVLARAQSLHQVDLHAFVFLSNHYHLLLSVDDALQLARFMNYLNSNLAREAGRMYDWKERFWGRRYQAIVISEEDAAQIGRLRYLLSHGCKEGLVARPRDWPGAHSVQAVLDGTTLKGWWFNRSREYAARLRGEMFHRFAYATLESIQLTPLPCWRNLPESSRRARIAEIVHQIEADTVDRHSRDGSRPLGRSAILGQDPHDRPQTIKKTPAPAFHAATKSVRKDLVEAYRWFLDAYRRAAQCLREGDSKARFPEGSFPPGLPFVGWVLRQAPG